MSGVHPEHDDAFWQALAEREWRRVRWRKARSPDAPPEGAVCLAYGLPIHRTGTYYVRPVYTDGTDWLSQQAYDAMVRKTGARRASRRTRGRD
ncbi:hypothetical protein [Rubrivirga sp. IMCC45206]|uniref:hypothetical protein n=1 Tax=Rubrivirga sp. IMCC45206 TaxID=3391614 RepID=UPI0039901CBF